MKNYLRRKKKKNSTTLFHNLSLTYIYIYIYNIKLFPKEEDHLKHKLKMPRFLQINDNDRSLL